MVEIMLQIGTLFSSRQEMPQVGVLCTTVPPDIGRIKPGVWYCGGRREHEKTCEVLIHDPSTWQDAINFVWDSEVATSLEIWGSLRAGQVWSKFEGAFRERWPSMATKISSAYCDRTGVWERRLNVLTSTWILY
jgi:hypothetical protein